MYSRLGGVTVLALLVISALLASCSTASSPPPVVTVPPDTKPYGSLTIAGVFPPQSFDPIRNTSVSFQYLSVAVFDSLVEMNPDGGSVPGIAERWEISPDGRTHTFYIRKGVKFHNGDDLAGADVKFSIERVRSPESTHTAAAVWRALIDKVELKDDYTVALQLRQPQFDLLLGFTDLGGSTAVVPKKYIEEKGADYFANHPVGSGPFGVVSYEPGQRMVLEANENHWRAMPKFKTITFLSVQEESTKVAMLKTGELDLAQVSPDSASGLKAGGLRIFEHNGGAQTIAIIYYDLDHPEKLAIGDVTVRKALSLGLNRTEIANNLVGGYAKPSTIGWVNESAYFWDSNVLKPDPYDPEGAKRLLAGAGYPSGFSITVFDRGETAINSQISQAIAGYWRKLGVDAKIVAVEYATWFKWTKPADRKVDPKAWNTVFPTITSGGNFGFDRMPQVYHSKGTSYNIMNPRLDELIDKVLVTRDPAEKKRLALEAVLMAKNEYNAISITDNFTLYALSSKIGDLTLIKGIGSLAPAFSTITHPK